MAQYNTLRDALSIHSTRIVEAFAILPEQGRTQFSDWNGRWANIEEPAEGAVKFWLQTPQGWGNDGAFVELFDVRPWGGEKPQVDWGRPELLNRTRDIETVFNQPNHTDTPNIVGYDYTRTNTASTRDQVGVSLTFGLSQKIGNDNTIAAAEFSQEITTAWEEEWSQGREDTQTFHVETEVPPRTRLIVENHTDLGTFRQTNTIHSALDFQIRVHAYWHFHYEFKSLDNLTETLAGRGHDYEGHQHNLVGRCRNRPMNVTRLSKRQRVRYEETIEVDQATWLNIKTREETL